MTPDDTKPSLSEPLDQPITEDFLSGLQREKAYQRHHWGDVHDRNKAPAEWFWLVGYLAGKALASALAGDRTKALHHTISAAAALAHWHDAIKGDAHDPDKSSDLERSLGKAVV